MESYGDDGLDQAQNDDSGSFGVKVQVQGISGRPSVVLNAPRTNIAEYPDVFLMENQQQGLLSYMSGSASSIQTPPVHFRSLRNHQKSSGIIRNVQTLPYHIHPPSPVNASPVMVKRARIPLPGADWEMEPEVENIPCHTSNIICRRSAPSSGDDLQLNRRESPRLGHRSRMRPDDKTRSRSTESRCTVTDPNASGMEMEADEKVRSAESTERSKVKDKSRTPSSHEREAQVSD